MPDHYDIKVNRSFRRNSVSLTIRDNVLFIKAPSFLPKKEIVNIIEKKKKWINKKLLEEKLLKEKCSINFKNGESFLYKGDYYFLKIIEGNKNNILLDNKYLYLYVSSFNVSEETIKNKILSWYYDESKYYIEKTVYYYKNIMNVSIKNIKISDYKSKWGSCSINHNLTFNWRIIMAPEEVIKYLVVHELSHIEHPNHSSMFWKNVEIFMPNYRVNRKWLRKNSRYLLTQFMQ